MERLGEEFVLEGRKRRMGKEMGMGVPGEGGKMILKGVLERLGDEE